MRHLIKRIFFNKAAINLIKNLCLFYIIYLILFLSYINHYSFNEQSDNTSPLKEANKKSPTLIRQETKRSNWNKCHLESNQCFDTFRCHDSNGLKVHIYENVLVGNISKEFKEIILTIIQSKFYESDPSKACLFIPLVDFLNENSFNIESINGHLKNLDQ